MEEWKDIIDFEGLYEISNLGNVRSKDTKAELYINGKLSSSRIIKGKQLKIFLNCISGRKYVVLFKNSKTYTKLVHRLVAEAFIPNPNNYKEINHIDEDFTNNCVNNLEWCTRKYNVNYGTRTQRQKEKMYKPVLQFNKNGEFIKEYKSINQASEETGAYAQAISKVCKGERITAGKYIWKYKVTYCPYCKMKKVSYYPKMDFWYCKNCLHSSNDLLNI